jgi:hypothetical protein
MKHQFKLTKQDAEFVLKHIPDSELKNCLEAFIDCSQLYKKIERLLIDNKKDPCWIPTIQELGEVPGGYALVKEISAAGGLKKVRPLYTSFYFRKSNELWASQKAALRRGVSVSRFN